MSKGIYWFRRDLRLADHPALDRASRFHDELLFVYIDEDAAQPYSASRAWLRNSLAALAHDLEQKGGKLHILSGSAVEIIPALTAACFADAVHIAMLYEPDADMRDAELAKVLSQQGVKLMRSAGRLLTDADFVLSKTSTPYRVFTPFFKAAMHTWKERLYPAPMRFSRVDLPAGWTGAVIDPPVPAWDRGFWDHGVPGEAGALHRLTDFLDRLDAYPDERDYPAIDASSRLSAHLHFGEISPGRVLSAVRQRGGPGASKMIAELGWREFAYYVLQHWPHTLECNFNPRFDGMAWTENADGLLAWQNGQTGIPLIDAGMRQLWHEGWMHNRVRMVVASWLTKHMGIHWRQGAAWFLHTLVDADIASNTLGWQWVAGTGVDAAPYFRIFNPVTQSRKFDAEAAYIRRWVPELDHLADREIHAPWESGATPANYPAKPIVDLADGRAAALERLSKLTARP